MPIDAFGLRVRLEALDALDAFALLACQEYNLGNGTDWFGCFRGGIYAVKHRIHGLKRHFGEVHAWIPTPRELGDVEYHLASVLFNADSALDCLVFGINALGTAAFPAGFLSVTDERQLRRISLRNVFGERALDGYDRFFPNFRNHCVENADLIETIVNLHDVSKHRSMIFSGGRMRDDPPLGYFERLGVADDVVARAMLSPMAEVIMRPDAKAPLIERRPVPRDDHVVLEELIPRYCDFLGELFDLANSDARATILLRVDTLRENQGA